MRIVLRLALFPLLLHSACGGKERDFGGNGSGGTGGVITGGAGGTAGGAGSVTAGSGGSGSLIGAPCSAPDQLSCDGAAQKRTAICDGGVWREHDTCDADHNCDNRSGTCAPILPECVGRAPGNTACKAAAPGVELTCGPDLVTASERVCAGACVGNACVEVTCGDGTVQTGEACDDGNEQELDGCSRCQLEWIPHLGGSHVCAVSVAGMKCWGGNDEGQLGLGDVRSRGQRVEEMGANLPLVKLGTGDVIKALALGYAHTCVLMKSGAVKCWGSNAYGQLGLGEINARGAMPEDMGDGLKAVDLGTGRTARAISAGYAHTCALLDNGTIKCWGDNLNGELGIGDTRGRGLAAADMGDNLPTVALPIGTSGIVLTLQSGLRQNCTRVAHFGQIRVWCWGHGAPGVVSGETPELMSSISPVILEGDIDLLSTGGAHMCARNTDEQLWCWGQNDTTRGGAFAGVLGLENTNNYGAPGTMGVSFPSVNVGTGARVSAVSAGMHHTCAILDDGALKCWGQNEGALGLGHDEVIGDGPGEMGDALQAAKLGPNRTVKAVTTGWNTTCALLDDNSLKCFGYNFQGRLGIGSSESYLGDTPETTPDKLPAVDLD